MISDSELVRQVRQGSSGACAELVRRYEPLVRASAMNVVHDHHAAEDVAQEAFLVAFRTCDTLRDDDRFAGWLLGIAKRQAMRVIESRARAPCLVPAIDAACAERTAGNPDELSEQSRRMLALVERLPDHERIVVGLRHFQGRSVQEIADIAGRPVGTVTKQLSRALERLRDWLQQEIDR